MGRKRKNRNNKQQYHKSSGSGGPQQQQQQKTTNNSRKKVKPQHERYWVEDCVESSNETFLECCDLQLLITRVELFHSSTISSPNNNSGVNTITNVEKKAAYSSAVAAEATFEPNTALSVSAVSSEPRKDALKQEMKKSETNGKASAEAKKEVAVEETSKQPENAEISLSKDISVEKIGSPSDDDDDGGGGGGGDNDDDDGGKSASKDDTIPDVPIPTIGIQRHLSARRPIQARPLNKTPFFHLPHGDCGDGILNPHPKSIVADKYWAQRKHLFARYDDGVQLDPEGWFSVTPEAIANHQAQRMVADAGHSNDHRHHHHGIDDDTSPIVKPSALLETNDAQQKNSKRGIGSAGMIILDAFAGVGGNSIAFARRPEVDLVVCVDTNDTRLRMAANNCRVYNIPINKVVFIHGDAIQVLSAYEKGEKKRVQGRHEEEPSKEAEAERISNTDNLKVDLVHGYKYGGLELLPDRLDAIFLSPPWGGSDYGDVGRRSYDLECIHLVTLPLPEPSTIATATRTTTGASLDGASAIHGAEVNTSSLINGKDLLALAANAVVIKTRNVAYFLPRNTNGENVAHSASAVPGIRLLEMEQNYLNYKLRQSRFMRPPARYNNVCY